MLGFQTIKMNSLVISQAKSANLLVLVWIGTFHRDGELGTYEPVWKTFTCPANWK